MRSVAPAAKFPTLAEVHPKWAALTKKLIELEIQREELQREVYVAAWATEAEGVNNVPAGYLSPRYTAPVYKPLSAAALASLAEFAPARTPQPPPPINPAIESAFDHGSGFNNEAADRAVQMRGIIDALDIIRPMLLREHAEGSRIFCDRLRDEYRTHATRFCAALVEMVDAYREHEVFKARVTRAGANPAFLLLLNAGGNMLAEFLGDPLDAYSPIRMILTSAAEAGHYDAGRAVARWHLPTEPLPESSFTDLEKSLRESQAATESVGKGRRFRVKWNGRREYVEPAGARAPRKALTGSGSA